MPNPYQHNLENIEAKSDTFHDLLVIEINDCAAAVLQLLVRNYSPDNYNATQGNYTKDMIIHWA
jgi:hypothetical protein